jgi:hypothetical protein
LLYINIYRDYKATFLLHNVGFWEKGQ